MSGYNIISKSIWLSKKFRSLEDSDAKLLFLYFLNAPSSNSSGCYVITIGYIMSDLRWSEDRVRKGIDTLCHTLLIGYHEQEEIVYIPNFLSHNPPTNPKHAIKVFNDTLSIPYPEFRASAMQDLATVLKDKGWELPEEKKKQLDTLSKGYPHVTQRNVTYLKKDNSNELSKESLKPAPSDTLFDDPPPPPDKPKSSGKRAKRLKDFLENEFKSITIPTEWGDWAYDEKNISVTQINEEWEKFSDYWAAQPGQKGVKADWLATWRNWIRRNSEQKGF